MSACVPGCISAPHSGFFIRICQRLRASRREREVTGGPAAGADAGGPVSFEQREQARERERARMAAAAAAGGGAEGAAGGGPRGGAAAAAAEREGGSFGTPGPAGGSPRVAGGFGGPPGMMRPGRGRGGGPDELDPLGDGGPPGGFRRRGRSSSRSPPPRRGGPGGFWGPAGECEGQQEGRKEGRKAGGQKMNEPMPL